MTAQASCNLDGCKGACGVCATTPETSAGAGDKALRALIDRVEWNYSDEDERAVARGDLDTYVERMRQPLQTLAAEINEINRANGWDVCTPADWPSDGQTTGAMYKIGTVLALIHSEVSEALEAVRKRDRDNFDEELADVLIRVLDCAGGLGTDLDAVVRDKLATNRLRGYRHGGKAV